MAVDIQTYGKGGSGDDAPPTITVRAVRAESCTRSGDGVTVYVSTYATSVGRGTMSLDEMAHFTDEAYDAAK